MVRGFLLRGGRPGIVSIGDGNDTADLSVLALQVLQVFQEVVAADDTAAAGPASSSSSCPSATTTATTAELRLNAHSFTPEVGGAVAAALPALARLVLTNTNTSSSGGRSSHEAWKVATGGLQALLLPRGGGTCTAATGGDDDMQQQRQQPPQVTRPAVTSIMTATAPEATSSAAAASAAAGPTPPPSPPPPPLREVFLISGSSSAAAYDDGASPPRPQDNDNDSLLPPPPPQQLLAVLAGCATLRHLHLEWSPAARVAAAAAAAEPLCSGLIASLAGLTQLQRLRLGSIPFRAVAALQPLSGLTRLELHRPRGVAAAAQFAPPRFFPALRHLHLDTGLLDARGLGALSRLTSLAVGTLLGPEHVAALAAAEAAAAAQRRQPPAAAAGGGGGGGGAEVDGDGDMDGGGGAQQQAPAARGQRPEGEDQQQHMMSEEVDGYRWGLDLTTDTGAGQLVGRLPPLPLPALPPAKAGAAGAGAGAAGAGAGAGGGGCDDEACYCCYPLPPCLVQLRLCSPAQFVEVLAGLCCPGRLGRVVVLDAGMTRDVLQLPLLEGRHTTHMGPRGGLGGDRWALGELAAVLPATAQALQRFAQGRLGARLRRCRDVRLTYVPVAVKRGCCEQTEWPVLAPPPVGWDPQGERCGSHGSWVSSLAALPGLRGLWLEGFELRPADLACIGRAFTGIQTLSLLGANPRSAPYHSLPALGPLLPRLRVLRLSADRVLMSEDESGRRELQYNALLRGMLATALAAIRDYNRSSGGGGGGHLGGGGGGGGDGGGGDVVTAGGFKGDVRLVCGLYYTEDEGFTINDLDLLWQGMHEVWGELERDGAGRGLARELGDRLLVEWVQGLDAEDEDSAAARLAENPWGPKPHLWQDD
ncbi:hypothetical protein HYH02_009541 [Chlamydomonas schloesseri]|uniref:Uncharacterized protein n=1 Tax=Chlamydomonas schloesseri TaxID=2026947 RepID=A0A835TPY5_9CHLO|nr:hypothetical protein HYH02_009541 [Chlamydomonas schloesseri]|eukprot:KAG2443130.1 hypothetical protein HYH02_009541 [Chlamydomonas schloesseri]